MAKRFLTKENLLVAGGLLLVWASAAWAGTGGDEFSTLYTTIEGWSQGYLGKLIAISSFITGMAIGIVRQSLMAIAVGVGSGMAVQYTPEILNTMVTALM
ncbi:MAG TPA: TraA family conjugative transfer protein [Syntrophales bacterium]|jgi:conjugal transfer pilus assembly protein TraA|nr:TraA family conjugative transfer protein [Syntrophales bacterium]